MVLVVTIRDEEVLEDMKWETLAFLVFEGQDEIHGSDEQASERIVDVCVGSEYVSQNLY